MAFWSNWFNKKPKNSGGYDYAGMLDGRTPIYSNGFGDNIYASDVVQQAIYSIITELKKLDPVHVRKINNDYVMVSDSIQRTLDSPNPLMITADLIEKVLWDYYVNYNAFVYPMWNADGTQLLYLYPIHPRRVDFVEDKNGNLYVDMTFANGYTTQIPYDNIIHIRNHYSQSEFMGGDKTGNPDYKPLLNTLQMNDSMQKGLLKALSFQTTINGAIKTKTMMNTEDQIQKIKEFENLLKRGESGILPIDITSDYIPISKQIALLDATTLKFIDEKILRTFGVSIPIVNGDYSKAQYEAFYQKTLEPIIKVMSQAFTKGIFSKRAAFGYDNKILFYAKELIFMDTAQKLSLFTMLGNVGGCYVNEMRTAFGMRPLDELNGVRMISLNYVNAADAKEYQLGKTDDTNDSNDNNDNNDNGGDGT